MKILKKYYGRAPLRIGLAGGGSDIKEHFLNYGGAVTNITINQYAHVFIEENTEKIIEFKSHDLQVDDTYSNIADVKKRIDESSLKLHAMTLIFFCEKFKLEISNIVISSYVDAPPGSGLGSSSTLIVAILMSLADFYRVPITKFEASNYAYEIERVRLGFAGGMQDQFAATFGGCNFLEFKESGNINVTPIEINEQFKREFEYSFALFNIGKSRDSSLIIKSQIEKYKDKKNISNTNELKKFAYRLKDSFILDDIKSVHEIIHKSWIVKKSLSEKISNKKIDDIYDYVIKKGAISYKVSGAGGGGFILVGTKPENKVSIIKGAESNFDISYKNFKIERFGFKGHFRSF